MPKQMNEKLIAEYKCPHCGSDKVITEEAAAPLRKSGKLRPEDELAGKRVMVQLLPPERTTGLTVPCAMKVYDECFDCGTEYLRRVSTFDAELKMIPPSGGGQGMGGQLPPGFGRG